MTVTRSMTRFAGRKSFDTMCCVARLSQNATEPWRHRKRHCTSGMLAARRGTLHCAEFPDTRRGNVHRAIVDIHRRWHCWQDCQERAEDPSRLRQISCPTIVEGSIGCDEEAERTASRLWILDKLGGHRCQSRPISIEVVGIASSHACLHNQP